MNLWGPFSLLRKELRRFMRIPGQTLLGPAATSCLYLAVFGLALAGARPQAARSCTGRAP